MHACTHASIFHVEATESTIHDQVMIEAANLAMPLARH